MANKKFERLSDKEFSEPYVLRKISEKTRRALIKQRARINVIPGRKGMAYTKENPKNKLWYEKGYDFLQYNIVVKDYILKRYNIKKEIELDILLYLMPFQFFAREDFMVLPIRSRGYNLKKLMKLEYIEIKIEKTSIRGTAHIYALTSHAKIIVKDYYSYLSGEKVLKPDCYTNPFRGKEAKKVDREREKLMLRLSSQIQNQPKKFKKSFS